MLNHIKTFSLAFIFILTACGPSDQEIKSLGFSNAAEMQDIQAKGFKTKQDYEAQKEAERQAQIYRAFKLSQDEEWVRGWGRYVKYLSIQSVFANDIQLLEVEMNRGGCGRAQLVKLQWGGYTHLPVVLKFGDMVKIDIDRCEVIEVKITSSIGTASYSWNE